jgi:HlyD family secretion protein
MRRLKVWLWLTAAVIGLAVIFLFFFNKNEKTQVAYKTAKVERGKILAVVTSTATVTPLNTVKVGSQISGNIQQIYVDYNSVVEKDEIIAVIDKAVYKAQLEQARAQLLMARTQLLEKENEIDAAQAEIESAVATHSSAKASMREAVLQFDRQVKLRKKKTVSQSAFDEAQTRRDNARGNVEVAKAKVQGAKAKLQSLLAKKEGVQALISERQAQVKLAEVKLNYCTIRSPIDGVVIERAVDVGQTVAASLQSPVLFTIAEDLTRMQLEIDVSEADVGQVKPDQPTEFTVDAYSEKKFKAMVRQVRNSPTNIQNVVTYKVIADVNNRHGLLRPGMTANVSIIVAEEEDVLKVPNAALRFRPPGAAKEKKQSQSRSAKENPFYMNTVKKLELSETQAKEFEKILESAGAKLRATMKAAEGGDDRRQALRNFRTQAFTQLNRILTEDQRPKMSAFIRELREKRKQFRGSRPAQVYVVDADGNLKMLNVRVGITNDSETEVKEGLLKKDDHVVVGLSILASESDSKQSSNPLMRLIGGRGRRP